MTQYWGTGWRAGYASVACRFVAVALAAAPKAIMRSVRQDLGRFRVLESGNRCPEVVPFPVYICSCIRGNCNRHKSTYCGNQYSTNHALSPVYYIFLDLSGQG